MDVSHWKGDAAAFAPSWGMVRAYRAGRNWPEYCRQYEEILQAAPEEAWQWLESQAREGRLILKCYCPSGFKCHTHLVVEWMVSRRGHTDGRPAWTLPKP